MIQKEKAKELIKKYSFLKESFSPSIHEQKRCAITATEIEYHSNRELLFNLRSCGMIQNDKVYLIRLQHLIDEEKEVKQEIEKL